MHRFDLSTYLSAYRQCAAVYAAVMTRDGRRGFVSLWNASAVADLDLAKGTVRQFISLRKPTAPLAGGSHPTALLLNQDDSRLFVALTNRDEIDALDTKTGKVAYTLSHETSGTNIWRQRSRKPGALLRWKHAFFQQTQFPIR